MFENHKAISYIFIMRRKLPSFLKKYFWDVDFERINLKEHEYYVIERLLEYGDLRAIKWLLKNFDKRKIKKVLNSSRALSKKTKIFFSTCLK